MSANTNYLLDRDPRTARYNMVQKFKFPSSSFGPGGIALESNLVQPVTDLFSHQQPSPTSMYPWSVSNFVHPYFKIEKIFLKPRLWKIRIWRMLYLHLLRHQLIMNLFNIRLAQTRIIVSITLKDYKKLLVDISPNSCENTLQS